MSRLRLTAVVEPANPPAGTIELFDDSAFPTKTLVAIDENGVRAKIGPPGIARTVAAVAIANTETLVLGVQLPASWLVVGTMFRILALGRLTSGVAGGISTFRVRIGATTLTGNIPTLVNATNSNSVTNAPFMVEFLVTVRTAGASGTAIGNGVAGGNSTAPLAFVAVTQMSAFSATVVVDTTVAERIELTYISGNAGTTATFENVIIKLVNGI